MYCDKLNLPETDQFPAILFDYLDGKPELEPFYRFTPHVSSFKTSIKNRNFDDTARNLLVRVLKKQYGSLTLPEAVNSNLEMLGKNKTFTVTTGHQLNIFTGPLYFIFKIISVINTCRKLKETYADYEFIPVYWMASEDHDLDEIRSFSLFGNTYSWETSQNGPVGRMDPSSLGDLLDQLPEDIPLFRKAYTGFNRLSDSVRYYVNELFGRYGLVVIDSDQQDLKKMFIDVMKDDILTHQANRLVENASARLEGLGYNAQVYPRSINLFYMTDHLRGRIIEEGQRYKVTDSEHSFSRQEILDMVDNFPDRFSPNVILRPLYQERILPNVAYVGGPAEVAYWLQLKEVFSHYRIPFPILMPRNFGMIIGKTLHKKIEKLQISSRELFQDIGRLKNLYLERHSVNSITLDKEKKIMEEILESVRNKTKGVDQSLEGYIEAEKAKIIKVFENMEKRLEKAEEKKHETGIRQLESLKDKLFPGGKLQERVENFLSFYINDPDFLSSLVEQFDPFDYRFNILHEE